MNACSGRVGVVVASVLLALMGLACSGSSTPNRAATSRPDDVEESTDGETGASPSGNDELTDDPENVSPPSSDVVAGVDGTTRPTVVGDMDISVAFGSTCVRPGEPQRVTIRATPGTGVAYHATYSDGKNVRSPGYPGGNNGGVTDSSGVWTDTWVIGAEAAPGPVTVDTVAQAIDGGRGHDVSTFEVAGANGSCAP